MWVLGAIHMFCIGFDARFSNSICANDTTIFAIGWTLFDLSNSPSFPHTHNSNSKKSTPNYGHYSPLHRHQHKSRPVSLKCVTDYLAHFRVSTVPNISNSFAIMSFLSFVHEDWGMTAIYCTGEKKFQAPCKIKRQVYRRLNGETQISLSISISYELRKNSFISPSVEFSAAAAADATVTTIFSGARDSIMILV